MGQFLGITVKRVARFGAWTGTLKYPTKCLWRWESYLRSNFFFSAFTYITEISLHDLKQPISLTMSCQLCHFHSGCNLSDRTLKTWRFTFSYKCSKMWNSLKVLLGEVVNCLSLSRLLKYCKPSFVCGVLISRFLDQALIHGILYLRKACLNTLFYVQNICYRHIRGFS